MKSWTIALKDTLIRFRDRNALIFMLAAPLVVSAIMGAAFGGQGQASAPLSRLPVAVIDLDEGSLGAEFIQILADLEVETADGGVPLFDLQPFEEREAALEELEGGMLRGVLVLPVDFSASLLGELEEGAPAAAIEILTDPTANVSPGILTAVVRQVADGFNSAALANRVAAEQAVAAAQGDPAALAGLAGLGEALAAQNEAFAQAQQAGPRISLESTLAGELSEDVNLMNYFVPSMAIFFLMFTLFDGTRSILAEERDGTLGRLMSTPTGRGEILLGKIGGVFLTGLLQFAVLVGVSALAFGVDWGRAPLAVLLLVLATVAAATSLGAFVASFARDINQANVLGTAVTLVFAILGGNFIDPRAFPDWLESLSRVTINRWALEGFTELTFDGTAGLAGVLPNIAVLFALAAAFFSLSLALFNRRFVR